MDDCYNEVISGESQQKVSGAKRDRKELKRALAALEEGNTLLVSRLDRPARSSLDLLSTVDTITRAGAEFRSLADAWCDTTTAHGKLILTVPDAAAAEVPRGGAGKALSASPLFEQAEFRRFHSEQILDENSFVGRAFSASYAPRQGAPAHAYEQSLRELFARYGNRGRVTLHYETKVYVARRKA